MRKEKIKESGDEAKVFPTQARDAVLLVYNYYTVYTLNLQTPDISLFPVVCLPV